jgi:long-chain acyl-CoA synthetase
VTQAALDTFPKLLVRNAHEFGAKTALREKEFGIWQSFSWQQYHDHVRDFSLGLIALGRNGCGRNWRRKRQAARA